MLRGGIFVGRNVVLGPFCFIRGPVFLGDNVTIGPYCEVARSIICRGTMLGHKNTVIDSIIGRDCLLSGYIGLCNNTLEVGREVKVWYQGAFTRFTGKFGAVIEDNVRMGIAVSVMPGTHISSGRNITGPVTVYGDGKFR